MDRGPSGAVRFSWPSRVVAGGSAGAGGGRWRSAGGQSVGFEGAYSTGAGIVDRLLLGVVFRLGQAERSTIPNNGRYPKRFDR
jgi:hypothetical protein